MNKTRENILNSLDKQEWDLIVVGGGATGLGIAVDAANRGLKTLLLERDDFSKSTSSKSTKLVHGGVRYLQNGDVFLVREALVERGRLLANAPHLVENMRFIIGQYRWWEKIFYTVGLTFYDMLSTSYGFGKSLPLSKKEVLQEIPAIEQSKLLGGVVYHDGQFDDARMAITLALSAQDAGAVCLNYVGVESLIKNSCGKICGVKAVDVLSEDEYTIKCKMLINATGVFVDEIMKMDNPQELEKVRPSRGVHLVVDSSFLGGKSALMIPKTADGRVLFGVPWHNKVILGTTDVPINEYSMEPIASKEEIDFILNQAGQYLEKKPTYKDILSVFAGLRPLAKPSNANSKKTKEISRSHRIFESASGLMSITGGKWTTYRAMAEDILDRTIYRFDIKAKECSTANLRLHGYLENADKSTWNYVYGSDIDKIRQIEKEDPSSREKLVENYSFTLSQVIFAFRNEFAQTIEDVLARRVRLLFLDAKAAIKAAPLVAKIAAKELGKSDSWQSEQVQAFTNLAKNYTV